VTPDAGGPPPLIEYPAEYVFKIMGLAADDFPEHALRLVARVVVDVRGDAVTVRASSGGKYLSVTVTAVLQSEEQRLAVYAILKADPRVAYAL
jgi:putative lipoic acid-binding regulatory protein